MNKIESVTCRKFAFEVSSSLDQVFLLQTPQDVKLDCTLSARLDAPAKAIVIVIGITFNGDALPTISSEWVIAFSELTEKAVLKEIVIEPHVMGALARLFGSLCNNINWIVMNTKLGPLPVTHVVFINLLMQSISQGQAAQSAPEEIKSKVRPDALT